MHTKNYSKGAIITTEGDLSDSAFYIKSGIVEIISNTPEGERVVGEHAAGDFFGEMGLILEAPRMATVRAQSEVVVEVYDLESFELEVIDDAEKRAAYLPNLFERMRLIYGLLRESTVPGTNPSKDDTHFPGVEMSFIPAGDSLPQVASQAKERRFELGCISLKTLRPLPGAKECVNVRINKFPYYIGRTSKSKILVENDFYINDPKPHKLSRGHCSIEKRGNQLIVRDRFSSLGTWVNGKQLGKSAGSFTAPLKPGDNKLILGDDPDRYSFQISVDS